MRHKFQDQVDINKQMIVTDLKIAPLKDRKNLLLFYDTLQAHNDLFPDVRLRVPVHQIGIMKYLIEARP